MMASNKAPWTLLPEGKYEEALRGLDRLRNTATDYDWRTAGERGKALLCLRRYDEAVDAYEEANRMATEEARRKHNRVDHSIGDAKEEPVLIKLGAAQWLAGHKEVAAATWQRAVRGVLNGTIFMGDMAGAVTQGLLLWFAGVSLHHSEIINEAEKYLTNRAKKSRIKLWPGPLVLLVLGKTTQSSVLTEKFGTENLDRIVANSSKDLLVRREFSQFLFYTAINHRARGDEAECKNLLRRCDNLENPLIEIEWYLARGELENS